MSVRQVIWAWAAALVLLLAATLAVLRPYGASAPSFDRVDVAVVGSSLLRHAVPPHGSGGTALLGDGRPHHRIALSSIGEEDLIALSRAAIHHGARVVLIEVNPFIRDFANADGLSSLRGTIKLLQISIAMATREALGSSPPTEPQETYLDAIDPRRFDPETIAKVYPFRFHEPTRRAALDELMLLARQRDARIVLLLPPRSQTGEGYLGKAQARELKLRAHRLADALGVPLFDPPGPWPDAEFVDQAHMNRAGRAHFQRELQHWWRGGND